MRKAVAFLFLLVLCFMAGCTAEKSDSQNLVIENVDWKISTVQSVEKEGTIIACGKEEASLNQEAEAVDITCTAETGKMLIHDHTHNKSYTFPANWKAYPRPAILLTVSHLFFLLLQLTYDLN